MVSRGRAVSAKTLVEVLEGHHHDVVSYDPWYLHGCEREWQRPPHVARSNDGWPAYSEHIADMLAWLGESAETENADVGDRSQSRPPEWQVASTCQHGRAFRGVLTWRFAWCRDCRRKVKRR